MVEMAAKLKQCWYKWYTFQLANSTKNAKWLSISINSFLGGGRKFGYRFWKGGTQLLIKNIS